MLVIPSLLILQSVPQNILSIAWKNFYVPYMNSRAFNQKVELPPWNPEIFYEPGGTEIWKYISWTEDYDVDE